MNWAFNISILEICPVCTESSQNRVLSEIGNYDDAVEASTEVSLSVLFKAEHDAFQIP